jgi:hypothetical protein
MGSKGKSTDSSQYESMIGDIAKDYWGSTKPLRENMLSQYADIQSGKWSPEQDRQYAPMYALARSGIENQYNVAKENVMSNTPRGGAMTAALSGLEGQRATDAGNIPAQIGQQLMQAKENQIYGTGWGAPGQAMAGLSAPAQSYGNRQGIAMNNKANLSVGGLLSNICCFIFLAEAQGRGLHPVVRWSRDEHMTDRMRRGYYRLADKIVPWMHRNQAIMCLVRLGMVDPMTTYGKWRYGYSRTGWLCWPVNAFWFAVFKALGFGKRYRRGNGEVV